LFWLLRDLDLLSVLARGATLSFEALLLGGVAFLLAVANPARASGAVERFCRKNIRISAVALICAELVLVSAASLILMSGSDFAFKEVLTTNFFRSDTLVILFAIGIWIFARRNNNKAKIAILLLSLLLIAAVVSTSHAAARIDHRLLMAILTATHHLGTAVWLGAMPYLLISLGRAESVDEARRLTQRYSRMALLGASALVTAGVGLALAYVGSWSGLYGTTYGVMVVAKCCLLLVMAGLGAGNWLLVRRLASDPEPLLARLRRIGEAEIALGFLAVLTAASLTSQPPAVDVAAQGRPTPNEIYARMQPKPPRMTSPPIAALAPPSSIAVEVQQSQFVATVGSDKNDKEWSEYNHHWAGLIVLIAGLLWLMSRHRRVRWARFWPLTFVGLAVFILLRADPENWPLGPRPFWGSFYAPDVLQHRFGALLVLVFAAFECAVQAGKLRARWAKYAFPAMCALGAAVLLTHEHSPIDAKEALLAEMSHTLIALVAITAAWGRWLELRLPKGRLAVVFGYLSPLCLTVVGLILLNYREFS
jgi:putative copper resistance protein D